MNEDGFLQAIREDPDDEALRLIYADWLDEQGRAERAEFIRIQGRLAREQDPIDDWAALADLRIREQELLGKETAAPRGRLAEVKGTVQFRRGFVEHITLDVEVFPKRAAALGEMAPIRFVRFANPPWSWGSMSRRERLTQTLSQLRELRFLMGLDCSQQLRWLWPQSLRIHNVLPLLNSPHLTGLLRLDLSANGLKDEDLRELAQVAGLRRLTTLDLRDNAITLRGVEMLLQSPYLSHLRWLDLRGNPHLARQPLEKLARALDDPGKAAALRSAAQLFHPFLQQRYNGKQMRKPYWKELVPLQSLADSRKEVRVAAAERLGQLGKAAFPAVPALVQRLHDGIPLVGQAAAAALARLAPCWAPRVQTWLRRLARTGRTPEENLREVLAASDLPAGVAAAFGRICQRRAVWRAWQGTGQPLATEQPPASAVPWGRVTDAGAVVTALLDLVEEAALRHAEPEADLAAVRRAARVRKGPGCWPGYVNCCWGSSQKGAARPGVRRIAGTIDTSPTRQRGPRPPSLARRTGAGLQSDGSIPVVRGASFRILLTQDSQSSGEQVK